MKYAAVLLSITICFLTANAQDLQIKQQTTMKMPNMPAMPPGIPNPFGAPKPSITYIKGGSMRTDQTLQQPKMTGGMETVTHTSIVQCDKQRRVSFNTKKKSYYTEPMAGGGATVGAKNQGGTVKKGGYITMSGVVTDTGERAKLFGYDARHLKQTLTITPGPNSCQKEAMKIDVDGWYVNLPSYSCPLRRKPSEFQMGSNCMDEVEYNMKGEVTGFPVKEIKTLTFQGREMNIEQETTEILTKSLDAAMFEPPFGYKAANSYKELEDSSEEVKGTYDPTIDAPQTTTTNTTLALPKAGIEKTGPVAKPPGVTRIGVVKPSVQLADKNSADGASMVSDAMSGLFVELLTKPNVEVVEVASAAEAKAAQCDYTIQGSLVQKHAGGGLLGQVMGLPSFGKGPSPSQGPRSPATDRLVATLAGYSRMKDEFTYDLKLVATDGSVAAQRTGKAKSNFPGEDVLSQPIRDVSTEALAKLPR